MLLKSQKKNRKKKTRQKFNSVVFIRVELSIPQYFIPTFFN